VTEQKTIEPHDLWADLPEWEDDHDPGKVLDWWREAEGLFAPLSRLAQDTDNETLQTAVWDAENRIRAQVRRWRSKVWVRLMVNIGERRLTPFGEALQPFLERARLTPFELLVEAGRIEEPHANETLVRHMHGPAPGPTGGYLRGFEKPLKLTKEERYALSRAYLGDSIYPWRKEVG
jgi:hypothetical protein